MRQKRDRLVIAFYTTHDAMAFEEACLKSGAAGRLIPLPKEISAGCGLAWSAPPGEEASLRGVLEKAGIEQQVMKICNI